MAIPEAAAGVGIGTIALGALSGALDIGGSMWTNQKNIDFARETRDWNAWYNSPAQQMKRYKEAGLNPNLIYGQNPNSVTAQSPGIENPVSGFMPKMHQAIQLSQQLAEIDMLHAQTANERLRGEYITQQVRAAKAGVYSAERENRILGMTDETGYPLSKNDPGWIRNVHRMLQTGITALKPGIKDAQKISDKRQEVGQNVFKKWLAPYKRLYKNITRYVK